MKVRHDALLDAYPSVEDLEKMVSFGLSQNLRAIANTSNTSNAVFDLLKWAHAQGRTRELLETAKSQSPGNQLLAGLSLDEDQPSHALDEDEPPPGITWPRIRVRAQKAAI